MDYKIAVSIIQLLGYVCAKLLGIKYISELKPEGRLKFIIGSAALSELSLIVFGLLPVPYNIVALFFNVCHVLQWIVIGLYVGSYF